MSSSQIASGIQSDIAGLKTAASAKEIKEMQQQQQTEAADDELEAPPKKKQRIQTDTESLTPLKPTDEEIMSPTLELQS